MILFLQLDGGSNVENLSLQNIEARIRMVLAFMLASLLPWVHSKPGVYLVLGSSYVDEGLQMAGRREGSSCRLQKKSSMATCREVEK